MTDAEIEENKRLDRREEHREEWFENRQERQQATRATKAGLNGVILVVLSVVLGATVSLLAWTANTVVELSKEVAAVKQLVQVNSRSIEDIQTRGSPVIQSVLARLDNLQAGQNRIEKSLDDHMKLGRP